MPTSSFFHNIEFKTKKQVRRFFGAMKKATKIAKGNKKPKTELYLLNEEDTKKFFEELYTGVGEQREADEKILKGDKE